MKRRMCSASCAPGGRTKYIDYNGRFVCRQRPQPGNKALGIDRGTNQSARRNSRIKMYHFWQEQILPTASLPLCPTSKKQSAMALNYRY